MAEPQTMLLKSNLKRLRLPTMGAEFAKLAREASVANEDYEQYLLRLTELEVATRSANAMKARIKQAGFPVIKGLDTYDFSLLASLSKPKILELARGEWIDQHYNCCLIGNAGTGRQPGPGRWPGGSCRCQHCRSGSSCSAGRSTPHGPAPGSWVC